MNRPAAMPPLQDDFHLSGIVLRYLLIKTTMTEKKEMHKALKAIEKDVRSLLDMFEFFLTERALGKPIERLGESLRDIRILISRIIVDHFLKLNLDEEDIFSEALASMLADRSENIPGDEEYDKEYHEYCIGEILTTFEYAHEIKEAYPDDDILQKILALDIPILRPFDYGMRGKFKVIERPKLKKYH